MSNRDARLRALLEEYQEAGEPAVALVVRKDGGTSYIGPKASDEDVADIFQTAANAFIRRGSQSRVLN